LPVRRRLWPNLLLGTLLILDGLKQAIRWTQLEATLPVFGLLEMTPLKVAASLSLGCLSAGAGLLLIAFAPAAKRFAAASIAGSTASLLLGWSALPEGIRQVTLARRAYQSRPVRDGEIEFLQIVTPYGAVALLVLLAALLYLCRARDA
jgi:hypothetical protein